MILTSQQPLYWPWLGSISKIVRADVFVLLDSIQFNPKSFQCRNKIRTKDGWIWLTIPTEGGRNQLIKDVKIDIGQNWRAKHLKSIELNYSKAPYFSRYVNDIRFIYSKQWLFLVDLHEYVLTWVLDQLNINTKIIRASSLNLQGIGVDRVIDMCKNLGATEFLVGEGAKPYTPIDKFDKINCKVTFDKYEHPEYRQAYDSFVPNMGCIDAIFCLEKPFTF